MDKRHALGESGEAMAAAYLEKRGLKIVARRVRLRRGEIDIVARDGAEWVFVEVKTRSGFRMGTAVEAMTPAKIASMARAVREYVHRHGLDDAPMRCDLLAIDFSGDLVPTIRHYPASIPMR